MYVVELGDFCKKIESLDSLPEQNKDMLNFANANMDENGPWEHVHEECKAMGITWQDVIDSVADSRERERKFRLEHPLIREDMYKALLPFVSALNEHREGVFEEIAEVLIGECGIAPSTMLSIEIASDFILGRCRIVAVNGSCMFAGGGKRP